MSEDLPYEKGKLLENIPFPIYKMGPGMNAGGLKTIKTKSLAHYWHDVNNHEDKQTESMLKGELFHAMLLEPERFRENYIVEPIFEGPTKDGKMSTRSSAAKEMKLEWHAKLKPGAIVVPEKWVPNYVGMSEALLKNKFTKNLLAEGTREVVLWWDDEQTGELCKGRFDFISKKGHAVDLKMSVCAEPSWFRRKRIYSDDYLYYLQAAHYCAGAKATGVCDWESFMFVAVEWAPPHGISTHILDVNGLGRGELIRSHLMHKYAQAKKTGQWTNYSELAEVAQPPDWLGNDLEPIEPYEEEEVE